MANRGRGRDRGRDRDRDRGRDRDRDRGRLRARDALGLVGTLLIGAVFVGVVLLAVWGLRRVVREAAPALAEVPGGGWTVGAVLGLLSLAGWAGGNRLTGRGQGVCWSVAVGVPIAVILALPGRNCRSDAGTCAYIPGTGGVAVAYGVTVAVAGGLWYLGRRSRAGR